MGNHILAKQKQNQTRLTASCHDMNLKKGGVFLKKGDSQRLRELGLHVLPLLETSSIPTRGEVTFMDPKKVDIYAFIEQVEGKDILVCTSKPKDELHVCYWWY